MADLMREYLAHPCYDPPAAAAWKDTQGHHLTVQGTPSERFLQAAGFEFGPRQRSHPLS
jgi:hypothetical protein